MTDFNLETPQGRLSGRVALITGGTSGIGKATAIRFAQEGARVAFTGRRQALGDALADELKAYSVEARFIPADHSRLEDCERVMQEVIAEFGRIDILFNNAGIVTRGTAEETSEVDWAYTMDLNVTAVWRMSRLALPHMRANGGGVIVNNASDWGLVGGPGVVAYCASKGAVIQLTRAMAIDHARENIRVNAVCPGDTFVERWVEEGYYQGSGAVDPDTALAESGASVPMGRVAQPHEIADAVLFLASDESSFMTGVAMPVDGGNTAR